MDTPVPTGTCSKSRAQPIARLAPMKTAIHHIEIWTHDLLNAEAEFDWILTQLGWAREAVDGWDTGRI